VTAAGRTRTRLSFPAAELPPGARKLVKAGRREIAVFNVDGTLYALKNNCPHQQAPLLNGPIGGTRLPSKVGEYCYGMHNQVLRCPWHAYEFDLQTGRSLAEPERFRVATYEVKHEAEEIAVYV
jgi:nitrite reductase/ring-hydroxylating ferredoxin subunit